jgi:hypothetical protein
MVEMSICNVTHEESRLFSMKLSLSHTHAHFECYLKHELCPRCNTIGVENAAQIGLLHFSRSDSISLGDS